MKAFLIKMVLFFKGLIAKFIAILVANKMAIFGVLLVLLFVYVLIKVLDDDIYSGI